jgi:hypothetical protein
MAAFVRKAKLSTSPQEESDNQKTTLDTGWTVYLKLVKHKFRIIIIKYICQSLFPFFSNNIIKIKCC